MEALLLKLSNLQHWEIALLATYFLLQGFFITIFPEEVIITTLGLLWSQGKIGFFEAWLAISAGLLPANNMTVFIGDRIGPRLLSMRPFVWIVKKETVEQSLSQIKKHATWVVITTRFIPLIRGPVYLAAGLSRMGVLRFMKLDALASTVQIPSLLLLGGWMGSGITNLMEGYRRVGIFMAVLLVTAFVANWIRNHRKKTIQSKENSILAPGDLD